MSLVPSKSPFHTHSSDWISATGKPVIQLAIWNIDMHLLPIKSISHMYLQVTLTMDPLLAMLGVAAFLYEAFFVYIRLHPDTSLKELILLRQLLENRSFQEALASTVLLGEQLRTPEILMISLGKMALQPIHPQNPLSLFLGKLFKMILPAMRDILRNLAGSNLRSSISKEDKDWKQGSRELNTVVLSLFAFVSSLRPPALPQLAPETLSVIGDHHSPRMQMLEAFGDRVIEFLELRLIARMDSWVPIDLRTTAKSIVVSNKMLSIIAPAVGSHVSLESPTLISLTNGREINSLADTLEARFGAIVLEQGGCRELGAWWEHAMLDITMEAIRVIGVERQRTTGVRYQSKSEICFKKAKLARRMMKGSRNANRRKKLNGTKRNDEGNRRAATFSYKHGVFKVRAINKKTGDDRALRAQRIQS